MPRQIVTEEIEEEIVQQTIRRRARRVIMSQNMHDPNLQTKDSRVGNNIGNSGRNNGAIINHSGGIINIHHGGIINIHPGGIMNINSGGITININSPNNPIHITTESRTGNPGTNSNPSPPTVPLPPQQLQINNAASKTHQASLSQQPANVQPIGSGKNKRTCVQKAQGLDSKIRKVANMNKDPVRLGETSKGAVKPSTSTSELAGAEDNFRLYNLYHSSSVSPNQAESDSS